MDLISSSIEHAASQKSRQMPSGGGAFDINKEYNAISVMMVKRGIVQDLARLTHSLDLSSPYLATTLNGALKSLETLSKVAGFSLNQPREKKKDDKKDEKAEDEQEGGASSNLNSLAEQSELDTNEILEMELNHSIAVDGENTDCDTIEMEEDEDIGEESSLNMLEEGENFEEGTIEEENVEDEENRSEDEEDDEDGDEEDEDDDVDDDDDDDGMDPGDEMLFGQVLNPYSDSNALEADFGALQSWSLMSDRAGGLAIPESLMNADHIHINGAPLSHWGTHDLEEIADYTYDGQARTGNYPTHMFGTYSAHDPGLYQEYQSERFMPFEDMFVNSSNFRRRTSTVNINSSSSTLRRALGRDGANGRGGHVSNADLANASIMEPLNPVHPLLNRVNDERSNQSHSGQMMSRAGPLRERMHYERSRPFGQSMAVNLFSRNANNILRYPPNPMNPMAFSSLYNRHISGPLRFSNSNRHGSASLQDAGLVFEDLVPDSMWSCYDSGESSRNSSHYLFPPPFYRWAEEAAVLDGESVHDLVLLFRTHIREHLMKLLKEDIEKRTALREERKKKQEKEKEEGKSKEAKKTEGVEVQVNLIVEDNAVQSDEGVASNGAPTPAAVTPGNLTPGTPANTPNNTTRNTPTHTNTHTPATSGPNTRPDSPIGEQVVTNHDDQLQAVSDSIAEELVAEQLSQEDAQSQTSFEYYTAESEPETADLGNRMDTTQNTGSDNEMSVDGNSRALASETQNEQEAPVESQTAAENATESTTEAQISTTPAPPVSEPVINPWEEIDPTFLVALPEEYRRDIYSRICDDVRRQATQATSSDSLAAINPEFLAVLPDNIRQEVTTAHDRAREEIDMRRQQQVAQQQNSAAQPGGQSAGSTTSAAGNGVGSAENDPASFIANLEPDLRRQILSDLDEETIARLPADLAQEARTIQQEIHARQIRFLSSRRPGSRPYRVQGRPTFMSSRLIRSRDPRRLGVKRSAIPPLSVRNLLDSESLACLLVIIFINDSNIQQNKLHRIMKNVSNHRGTRDWLTTTLIEIIKRTSDATANSLSDVKMPEWLSLKLEASLGTRHCVFHLNAAKGDAIQIHAQAASYICRATLDCLIYLAKCFPRHFVTAPSPNLTTSSTPADGTNSSLPNFWDLLLRLEHNYSSKAPKKADSNDLLNSNEQEDPVAASNLAQLNNTIMAQLLRMLKHPVINENRSLIDKMLNLLGTTFVIILNY